MTGGHVAEIDGRIFGCRSSKLMLTKNKLQ